MTGMVPFNKPGCSQLVLPGGSLFSRKSDFDPPEHRAMLADMEQLFVPSVS